MGAIIKIDEMNNKILHALIKDARAKLLDIAKECNTSSVSVLNRIKRLKRLGVITKGTLIADDETTMMHQQIRATIGIELDWNHEQKIIKFIQEKTDILNLLICIGKYDLIIMVQTENITELEKIINKTKKQVGVMKVTSIIWSKPYVKFENIDLQPMELDRNGQT